MLSEKDVRLVRDRVVELFSRMETTGAFGAAPAPSDGGPLRPPPPQSPRRKPTSLEREKRKMTPEMLARQANIGEALSAAMAAVQTKGRSAGESVSWYSWLTLLASAAYDTLPGTPEREKVLADALEKCTDKELARNFAALALDGLDKFFRRK